MDQAELLTTWMKKAAEATSQPTGDLPNLTVATLGPLCPTIEATIGGFKAILTIVDETKSISPDAEHLGKLCGGLLNILSHHLPNRRCNGQFDQKLTRAVDEFGSKMLSVKNKMEAVGQGQTWKRFVNQDRYSSEIQEYQWDLYNGFGNIILALDLQISQTLDTLQRLAFSEWDKVNVLEKKIDHFYAEFQKSQERQTELLERIAQHLGLDM